MAQLAIKGHPEMGNEVIERLEMLGGNNANNCCGNHCDKVYFINENGYINRDFIFRIERDTKFIIFSLEEFLEKVPYKVGDKIMIDDGDKANIVGMVWDNDIDEVFYEIQIGVEVVKYPKELLHPYIEKIITIDDFKTHTKEWLIDKLHGMIISDAIKTIGNIHDELHKPQYPKTYEECCRIIDYHLKGSTIIGYKKSLLGKFQKLIICRDAYWKIARDERGLGKAWKQDYNDRCFIIANNNGNIHTYEYHGNDNVILAFPTKEMRDAFYENFKELIERCKELL